LTGEKETKQGMSSIVYANLAALGCEVYHLSGEASIKTRYIDKKTGYQMLRIDEDSESEPILFSGGLPDKYDAIVISDYNKGYVTVETVKRIKELFEGPVFVDTKKNDITPFFGCYVKINESEYNALKSKVDSLIVTRGNKGCMYKNKIYSTEKVEVHDVTGAGDVHLSALTVFYLLYGSIEEAIPLANKLATISVQHQGAYTITNDDLSTL
jgi:D-beta-D-heptose 7-phosphate kinase/D-beta-D-heptose 1-phosphate adenosyltransferase